MSNQTEATTTQTSEPIYSVYHNGTTVDVTHPDGSKFAFQCLTETDAKRMARQLSATIEIATGLEVVPF